MAYHVNSSTSFVKHHKPPRFFYVHSPRFHLQMRISVQPFSKDHDLRGEFIFSLDTKVLVDILNV